MENTSRHFIIKPAPDYIKVMGIQLISGRDFNPLIASDTINSVLVNESLVTDLGLTNEKILGFRLKGFRSYMTLRSLE